MATHITDKDTIVSFMTDSHVEYVEIAHNPEGVLFQKILLSDAETKHLKGEVIFDGAGNLTLEIFHANELTLEKALEMIHLLWLTGTEVMPYIPDTLYDTYSVFARLDVVLKVAGEALVKAGFAAKTR